MANISFVRDLAFLARLNNNSPFTNEDDFKKFVDIATLNGTIFSGKFNHTNLKFIPGRGYFVERNYCNNSKRSIYVEIVTYQDSRPSEEEIFGDMAKNLTFLFEKKYNILINSDSFDISKKI